MLARTQKEIGSDQGLMRIYFVATTARIGLSVAFFNKYKSYSVRWKLHSRGYHESPNHEFLAKLSVPFVVLLVPTLSRQVHAYHSNEASGDHEGQQTLPDI
jgi:hypothetical protein